MRTTVLPRGWSAVVPVRDFATAKTRLRGALSDESVAEIARGLALRGVAALRLCEAIERIWVVSNVDLSGDFACEKTSVLVQRPDGGLNEAVREGLARARAAAPRSPVLVIHADLPGANAEELSSLIGGLHRRGRDSFLPDHTGRGSTLLAFFPGSRRTPAFGTASAERHAALGFQRIDLPQASRLRNDLDTVDDYAAMMGDPLLRFRAAESA